MVIGSVPFISQATHSSDGRVAALRAADDVEMMVAEFRARRDVCQGPWEREFLRTPVRFLCVPGSPATEEGLFHRRLLKEALIAPNLICLGRRSQITSLSYATSQNGSSGSRGLEKILWMDGLLIPCSGKMSSFGEENASLNHPIPLVFIRSLSLIRALITRSDL